MKLKPYLLLVLLISLSQSLFAQNDSIPMVITKVSTQSLNFGANDVGSSTGVGEVEINFNMEGNVTFSVSGPFEITTDWRGYYRSKSIATGTSGDSEIYVDFEPTGAGSQSGSLTITTQDGDSRTVSLSGIGVPLPTLSVPGSLGFGSQPVGVGTTKYFILKGSNVVSDTQVVPSGAFGGGGTFSAAQVNAGVQVGITFYPNSESSQSGSATVTTSGGSDGENSIIKMISLTGTGFTGLIDPDAQNAIASNSEQVCTAEPIQLGTGSYEYSHIDLKMKVVNTSLDFVRYYNSMNDSLNSPMGYGWSHSFNYKLVIINQGERWNMQYPDGHVAVFIPPNTNSGISRPLYTGTTDSLVQDPNSGTFILYTKDNHQYFFSTSGILNLIEDSNGNQIRLIYDNKGNLTQVTGPGGRTYKIGHLFDNIAPGIILVGPDYITSITDPLNRTCRYSYDSNGNLASVKDANGNTTSFTYDASHRILTATNPLGDIVIINTYDAQGRVIKQLDAYNQATSIAYNTPLAGDVTVTNPDNSQFVAHHDSAYRKTYIKDELGFVKTYTYDANSYENKFIDENGETVTRQFDKLGNLLVSNQPGNETISASYNQFSSPLKVTDANGNVTAISYNDNNNPLTIQLPDKTTKTYTYDQHGQCLTSTDGRGNTTSFTYSAAGDLLSVIAPNGTKTYGYDAIGRLLSSTDENGHVTITTYDNNDNVLTVKDALNHTASFSYDANNKVIGTIDKNGNSITFVYDKKGRLITKTNANGGITKNAYDVRDNLVSITDANNNTVSFIYDKKNRKIATTNFLGTAQIQYDGAGNVLKAIDGTSKVITYTYTPTYKVKTMVDGLGNAITYSYDKNGNLTTITDPLSKITGYGFDAMNRLITAKDALGHTSNVTYDQNGNKKTTVDANGHTQTYGYDAANRLITYQDAGGNTTSYTYDATGNSTTIKKPTGTITQTYDVLNRLASVTNTTGDHYNYTYDNNGNVLTAKTAAGTSSMSYDKLNELTQYTDAYQQKISYTYDAAGNKTALTYPGNKAVNYAYDKANNLKQVTDWFNHTFSYSYDGAGRITDLAYPNNVHTDYTYDAAGRLITQISTSASKNVITGDIRTLDATGKVVSEQKQGTVPTGLPPLSKVYGYSANDAMLKDSAATYTNDNAGNRVAETNGSAKTSYVFSTDNWLDQLTNNTGKTTTYGYDAWGNRLTSSSSAASLRYVVDHNDQLSQVLQLTDGNGVIKSQFVYGPGLLERIDSAGNALYYQYDAQHNTAALTNATGAITDTYTYDPFGTLLSHTGTTSQPFTFLGEFGAQQETASLYYDRARYYDAANGRFLSMDPYPYDMSDPQTVNRYVYGLNNGINRYDASGMFSWSTFDIGMMQLGVSYLMAFKVSFIVATIPETGIIGRMGFFEAINAEASVGSAIKDYNESTQYREAAYKNIANAIEDNDELAHPEDQASPGGDLADFLHLNKGQTDLLQDGTDLVGLLHFAGNLNGNIDQLIEDFEHSDNLILAEQAFEHKLLELGYDVGDALGAINKLENSFCGK